MQMLDKGSHTIKGNLIPNFAQIMTMIYKINPAIKNKKHSAYLSHKSSEQLGHIDQTVHPSIHFLNR